MIISPVISQAVYCCYRCLHERRFFRAVACALLVAAFVSPPSEGATIVRMETSVGDFNVELYDTQAPLTVTNFLNYVNRGDYNNIIIHRSVPGFVVQGGGYKCCNIFGQTYHILTDPPVPNEFDLSRSNIRGTIAMAKLPAIDDSGNPIPDGGPDSATSEWFFNLNDNNDPANPLSLDNQNGGFTVFGHILDSGMDVVDTIANLPIISVPGLSDLPIINNDYVTVGRVCINDDGDGVCSATEDLVPGGDGNGDHIADRDQANVATILAALGNTATFSADTTMKFESVGAIDSNTVVSWLRTFTSPPTQSVHFNNGMFALKMSGVMDPAGNTVTLYDGATARPTHYYAYGPTPDDPFPHWYDFVFDGETGAEIKSDRIILHFVDGQRGDEDLTANNSITHTGGQAVVTTTSTTQSAQSGGCSITMAPSRTMRGGDWIVVSLFLIFIAFVRRRAHRQQF